MEPEFVTVVVTATGRKQRVPAHYLDHPILSRGIALPPSARAGSEPTTAWTRGRLDDHAEELGLNPAEYSTKADVLDAIKHHQTTPPSQGEDETPDAGDDEEN